MSQSRILSDKEKNLLFVNRKNTHKKKPPNPKKRKNPEKFLGPMS